MFVFCYVLKNVEKMFGLINIYGMVMKILLLGLTFGIIICVVCIRNVIIDVAFWYLFVMEKI